MMHSQTTLSIVFALLVAVCGWQVCSIPRSVNVQPARLGDARHCLLDQGSLIALQRVSWSRSKIFGAATQLMCLAQGNVGPHSTALKLSLRGGGPRPKRKKRPRSGRGTRHKQASIYDATAVRNITAGSLLDTDAIESPSFEGPQISANLPREGRQSPSLGLDSILMGTDVASNEEDVEEVGLPYQQMTPLFRGHKDKRRQRDAESYCAEAARCLGRLEIEGAEACYQEALKLQPEAPWCTPHTLYKYCVATLRRAASCPASIGKVCGRIIGVVPITFGLSWPCTPQRRILNAYASLLADQGQVEEAVVMFNKSISVDANHSHVPHLYLGQVLDGAASLAHMRAGVAILEAAEADRESSIPAHTPAQDAGHQRAGSPNRRSNRKIGSSGDRRRADGKTIRAALCSARCALGEALLAYDDTGGADAEAEALFRAAMLACPDVADAHQALASLRLSQGQADEAGAYMQSVLRIISETRVECLPSIDFRLQSAKLLIGEVPRPHSGLLVRERFRASWQPRGLVGWGGAVGGRDDQDLPLVARVQMSCGACLHPTAACCRRR